MRLPAPRVAAAALLISLSVAARAQEAFDPGPPMERLVERYVADRDAVRSFHDVPASASRSDRLAAFTANWLRRLDAVDHDGLDLDGKIDATLLRAHLVHEQRDLGFRRVRDEEAAALLPFAADLAALEEARRAMEPTEPRVAAEVLHAAKKSLDATRKRLEAGLGKEPKDDALTTTPVIALRAARGVDSLRRTLAAWFRYRDGYEPEFGWWTRDPHRALDKALHEYGEFLRKKVAKIEGDDPPLVGDPIGREALLADLESELIAYTPEELVGIAEREFAWCEAEGRKAAEELGLGGDWAAAVEKVKTLHKEPGEQPAMIAEQARHAIRFVEDKGLVTVPELCKETWRLEMLSPERQKTAPFALYGGQQMLVAYPTEGMPHESKLMSMRGNNEHFTRIVTPHELIPGHHLQRFMQERHRAYRGVFSTPFLVEGWALHWELLLWNEGYARNAADRVGMLFWRRHRCARIIVSLGFHLGTMKPDEMVRFLVERVGLEEDGARAEVRRYVGEDYGPLYQCAYMIGGLQLRRLRRDLVDRGTMTDLTFHDAVLREGAVPIDMIRAALTKKAPEAGHRPTWRFAD